MDPLQKTLTNMKHCAAPSLAKCYEEFKQKTKCMKVNMQNHADCCDCKELCCTAELPKQNIQKQTSP